MQGSERRYLLRLWSDSDGGETWRASLRNLHGDDDWHFASIDQLLAHLTGLTATGAAEEAEQAQPGREGSEE